jgi:hypothetical protein
MITLRASFFRHGKGLDGAAIGALERRCRVAGPFCRLRAATNKVNAAGGVVAGPGGLQGGLAGGCTGADHLGGDAVRFFVEVSDATVTIELWQRRAELVEQRLGEANLSGMGSPGTPGGCRDDGGVGPQARFTSLGRSHYCQPTEAEHQCDSDPGRGHRLLLVNVQRLAWYATVIQGRVNRQGNMN